MRNSSLQASGRTHAQGGGGALPVGRGVDGHRHFASVLRNSQGPRRGCPPHHPARAHGVPKDQPHRQAAQVACVLKRSM